MSILLLDVDGVLVSNKAITEYVIDKSARYLQKYAKVPTQYKTYKIMKELNTMAYTQLGHTSMIVDDTQYGVWNYNNYVFDNDTLEFVKHTVNDTDRRHMNELVRLLQQSNQTLGLCTNTPLSYCIALFEGLHVDIGMFSLAFTSDSGYLKPTENFFEHVDQELRDNYHTIHFLDDSIKNVGAVRERPLWNGIHVPKKKALFRTLGHFVGN